MIKIENINVAIDGKNILKDVSMEVASGEFVCLVGESGSGKTTLLKTIAGLLKPSKGKIVSDSEAAMVFQSAGLLPWLTVKQNILFPFQGKEAPKDSKIEEILRTVGLQDHENKYPRDLSGGQKQRVGIARALIVNRKLLLLDEPFSALDIKTAAELHADLLKLWKQNNLTIVMVSHLVEEAVELADRVVIMQDGKIRREVNYHLERPRQTEESKYLKVCDHIKELIEN